MARQSGLGKGLGALIPSDVTASLARPSTGPRLDDIPVEAIDANPNQPRVHFDEVSLTELSDSIREVGVLQPILVRPVVGGRFELVAGERRWRAARRAGLTMIPAVIRETDDSGSVEQALIENLHRQDLTPLEEAAAYQQLIEEFGLTHEQVATRVGKSRSTVTNMLRLMSLPAGVQHLLADGRLSAGHARALLGTPDRARQEELARRAVEEGWSVRLLEDAVRGVDPAPAASEVAAPADEVSAAATTDAAADSTPAAGVRAVSALRPPGLLELEQLLADHLATRVAVTMGAKHGKITIDFADLEDLERIYYQMVTTETTDND